MSNPASRSAAWHRRFWPLLLVCGLALALVAAWTALWFYAAGQAKAEMAAWRERERQAGRQQDCASLSVGGYPMGIEVRCVGAGFEIEGTPSYRLDLPSVLATVRAHGPAENLGTAR